MTYGTVNVDSVVNSDGVTSGGLYGFKNRIINGAMMIDQRNAGASVTPNNTFTLDRWAALNTQTGKFTVQQSSTAPAGFTKSLLVTSSSAYSVLTGDTFGFKTPIEGLNIADFGWGAAGAATVTLSFWVRSSLTGTFGGALENGAANRAYPFSYAISAANTWEQKTVTIAGDTTGTWATDNTLGLDVRFGLGSGATFSGTANAWAAGNIVQPTGSTSVVGTSGATLYITGVQLEKGSTATSFDYRPYGTELALCQRYCMVYGGTAVYEEVGYGNAISTTVVNTILALPVQMRTQPSSTQVGSFQVSDGATGYAASNLGVSTTQSGNQQISMGITSSGLTAQRTYRIETANSTASRLILSAEL